MKLWWWISLVVACGGQASAPAPAPPAPAPDPVELPPAALPADANVEIVPEGYTVDAALPVVVAVHGLGSQPEVFAHLLDDLGLPVRVVAPRGMVPYGDGYSWWPLGARDDRLNRTVAARQAADRVVQVLAAVVERRRVLGEPVIVGFSQGGLVAYAVAVSHPEAVSAAFPVAGWLPQPMWPDAAPPNAPRIEAWHGQADTRVPLAPTVALWDALDAAEWPLVRHEIPAMEHTIPAPVRAELLAAIAAAATPPEPKR